MTKIHPHASHEFVKKVRGKMGNSWPHKKLLSALRAHGWQGLPDVSTISKYVSGSSLWPEDIVPHLAAVLGLPEYNTTEAIEREGPYWSTVSNRRHRNTRSTVNEPASLENIAARIDEELTRAYSRLPEAMKQTVPLYAAMTNQHYFFGTTFTEMPLIFQHDMANKEFIEAHYSAIRNGGMLCFLVPDQQTSANALIKYSLTGRRARSDLKDGFEKVRSGVISFLKKLKPPVTNAEEYTDTHLQLLTFSELPLTPICWTVTLIGGRSEDGQREIKDRILIRAPEDRRNVVRLLPHMDRYGRWVKHFAIMVIDSKLDGLANSDPIHEEETLRIYLTNLRNRLMGDPDSKPTVLKFSKSSRSRSK